MLRRGLYYPEKKRWTLQHLEWLHRQRFEQRAAQLTLEADLELVAMLKEHLKRLEFQITEQIENCEYREVFNALMCFRGIAVTTAFGLAVEIGDWTRFTGSSIGSYVGLVPSEHSSGVTRSQGPITKAGNSYARRLLAEAAMEGNRRLHHIWEQFNKRGKLPVKANTAVARELAGWCWSVAAPLQQKAATGPIFTEAAMHAA